MRISTASVILLTAAAGPASAGEAFITQAASKASVTEQAVVTPAKMSVSAAVPIGVP